MSLSLNCFICQSALSGPGDEASSTACESCSQELATLSLAPAPAPVQPGLSQLASLPPSFRQQYSGEKVLGSGRFGIVIQATRRSDGRTVAVKILRSAFKSNALARFLGEGSLAVKLRHQHLVESFEFQCSDGVPYLVMEYLEGGSLRGLLRVRNRLDIPWAVRIADHIAGALSACHAAGVVHRDVKPENVLLDAKGQAKLADLGLAKAYGDLQRLTRTGTVLGTPLYMAPEQVRGELSGTSTDLYALGVLLYEMLAGHPPYEAKNLAHLIVLQANSQPTPIRKLRPDVPAALAELVHQALAIRISDRPPDAEYFRHRLARALAPPSAGWAHQSHYTSRKAVAIAVATVTLLSLTMYTTSTTNEPPRASATPDTALPTFLAAVRDLNHGTMLTQMAALPGFATDLDEANPALLNELYGFVAFARMIPNQPTHKMDVFAANAKAWLTRQRWWVPLQTMRQCVHLQPIPQELPLYDALLSLEPVERMFRVQHIPSPLSLEDIYRPLVDRRARVPADSHVCTSDHMVLTDQSQGWIGPEFSDWTALKLWADGCAIFTALFPALRGKVDGISLRTVCTMERQFDLPQLLKVPRGSRLELRVTVAFLAPWQCLVASFPAGDGHSEFRILFTHPGQPEWYAAMNGYVKENNQLAENSPAKVRAAPYVGELRAAFPADLMPSGCTRIRLTLKQLPPVDRRLGYGISRALFTTGVCLYPLLRP
jgi:serine/threonine protein kinase